MVEAHGDAEDIGTGAADLVDAHCHLDARAFEGDLDGTLARARRAGVRGFVVAGVRPDRVASSLRSRSIRVAIGLHPWTVATTLAANETALAALADGVSSVDALGEIGLDAHHASRGGASLDVQREVFARALAIGRHAGLPLVLHVVQAHAVALETLRAALPLPPFVVHGYVGSAAIAAAYVRAGGLLSFGHDSIASARTHAAIEATPDDHLLVETDSPGGALDDPRARHDPASLVEVVRSVGAIRGASFESIARATSRNAQRTFPSALV